MWFVASKVILSLVLPPASLLLLLLAGFVVIRRHPGLGRLLVLIAVLFLYLLSLPLTADLLMRSLESAYPPFTGDPGDADAVVVLGGGVQDLSWVPIEPRLSGAALDRLMTGVELAGKFRLPLVAAGGTGEINGSTLTEADVMAGRAVRMGIPAGNIVIESHSRNTWENARNVRKLLDARTVIVVTSAFHMKRAAAMFKNAGFAVIPAPTAYQSQKRPASWTNLLPRSENLDTSARAIAEHLSLTWYGIAGAL